MLTPSQTKSATLEAFTFIALNPLAGQQALRGHINTFLGGDAWGDATDVVLQDVVSLEQRNAFATADKAAKDAVEAQVLADWKARMDAPVQAAPVYQTAVTPVAPKTYADHIEAIKAAYIGPDPENEAFNLQAACRYALLNNITPDQVAGAIGRHHTECHNLMFPR